MPIKYIPFIPEPIEGQAVLGNFNRILKYKGADEVSMTLQRGMPLYEMEKVETVGENTDGNMVIRGECVSACAYLKEQGIQVDLVYIDPPFASGADYAKKVYIRRNPKVVEAITKAEQELDIEDLKVFEEKMYGDVWDKEKYLNWMYENLRAIKSVMSETASIYVHLDWHIGHYVKILMDEIFTESCFRNEIIWKRGTVKGAKAVGNQYARNYDVILYYSKSQEWIYITMKQYIDTIKKKYHDIAGMNVGRRLLKDYGYSWNTPVDIDEEKQKFITDVAEKLELSLPESFFYLGDLRKASFTSNPLTGPALEGLPQEKKKYKAIEELYETILKALDWAPIEESFSDKDCIRLAVQNCGKAIDEDVEVTFELPQKALVTLDKFPKFNNDEMGYLLNDCDMSILFGIDSTAEYVVYSESKRDRTHTFKSRSYGLPGYVPNYSDDFIDELNDVFCYAIYPDNDKFIVKLKVDYIKHNTTVAFPSILFVSEFISEIPYKITSKNNPNVMEGILKVSIVEEE